MMSSYGCLSVRPPFRPTVSVCNAVCWDVQGRRTGLKLFQRVPTQLAIYFFRHFCSIYRLGYRLATKCTEERNWRNATWSCLDIGIRHVDWTMLLLNVKHAQWAALPAACMGRDSAVNNSSLCMKLALHYIASSITVTVNRPIQPAIAVQ